MVKNYLQLNIIKIMIINNNKIKYNIYKQYGNKNLKNIILKMYKILNLLMIL